MEENVPNPVLVKGFVELLLGVFKPPVPVPKLVQEPGCPVNVFVNDVLEASVANRSAPLFFGINIMKTNEINIHTVNNFCLFIISKILHIKIFKINRS